MSELVRPVTSKRQHFELWRAGAFGNKLKGWRSLSEWLASGHDGEVALRQLRDGGGRCSYFLQPHDLVSLWHLWISEGVDPATMMVSEMAPDHRLVLNGEFLCDVLPDGRWGHFHFSRLKMPQRISLREAPEMAEGLAAQAILSAAMTTASWEDFEELSRKYQGHVIELSVYDHCLGDLPSRNTIIWEVRKY